jgi:DNA (cytosine-5)-methyltransferase 1
MTRPKALDLFCGGGGASMGLYRAGFDVVGVDILLQEHYPFTFYQADALTFPLEGYDLIWASPPCQFASECTPLDHRVNHPNLIPAIRERLEAAGTPYMIENVEGARSWLRNPIMLCGSMFGLRVWRHRYFECPALGFLLTPSCNHADRPIVVSGHSNSFDRVTGIRTLPARVSAKREAMGIDWMTRDEILQAIPPAYSKYLAEQLIHSKSLDLNSGVA